ncbi:hypothetical protein U1Q18_003636 [Sarracenia purpurea var. burkii]
MMEGIPQIKARKGGSESPMEIAPTGIATYPHNANIGEKEKADCKEFPMVDLGVTMSEWANTSDEVMTEGTPQVKAKNKGLEPPMEIAQDENTNHPYNTVRGEQEKVVCEKPPWVDLGLARSEWANNMGPKINISLGRIELQQKEDRLYPQAHQTDISGALTKDHQILPNIAEAEARAEDTGTAVGKLPKTGRWKKLARKDKRGTKDVDLTAGFKRNGEEVHAEDDHTCNKRQNTSGLSGPEVPLSRLGKQVALGVGPLCILFRLAKRAVLSILGACVGVFLACVGDGEGVRGCCGLHTGECRPRTRGYAFGYGFVSSPFSLGRSVGLSYPLLRLAKRAVLSNLGV